MLVVPIKPLPNQSLQAQLGDQPCTLNVFQTAFGLYMDVLVAGAAIVSGVACLDRNKIVRSEYLGFVGDLAFVDLLGTDDPVYTGLGDRFVLVYIEAADQAVA